MNSGPSEIKKMWERVLNRLQEKLNDEIVFSTFFSRSYIHEIQGKTIVVVVETDLALNLIKMKYTELVIGIVQEVTESDFVVSFVVSSALKKSTKTAPKPEFFAHSHINSNMTFSDFVVGDCNKEAFQASITVSDSPGTMFNPLFIFSNSGLGKTHLLQGIANHIKKKQPTMKILYISGLDFIDEFVSCVTGEDKMANFTSFFKSIDVLLVDDIQMLAGKKQTQNFFFNIFSTLINNNKQVVLTSDKQPSDLQDMEERLTSRFNQSLVLNINKPDVETSKTILIKKIEATDLTIDRIDDDVITLMAQRFSNNVRELEGALTKLIFYSINTYPCERITLSVALDALKPLINSFRGGVKKLDDLTILNTVASYYNLSPSQVTSKSRQSQIVWPRHIAMYLMRELLNMPYTKIGDVFGGKDHTTIMNACKNVENGLKTNHDLSVAIADIKKRFKK